MTNLSTLLEYLDEDINEAAKSVRESISEKLAAYTSDNYIILYNPQTALANIQSKLEQGYPIQDSISFEGAIVGEIFIEHNDSSEAYEVKQSVAISGYGPLLYDLTLSHIYPNYLMSDRNSVNNNAKKIWKFYYNNRPDVSKVIISPVGDNTLPMNFWQKYPSLTSLISKINQLESDYEDSICYKEPPQKSAKLQDKLNNTKLKLNTILSKIPEAHKYKIKSPKGLTALKNNNARFIETVKATLPKSNLKGFDITELLYNRLKEDADTFFNEMY